MMGTHFAPAERASEKALSTEIEIVSQNPFIEGLLQSVSGLLAVLNEYRQLVALNDSFMQMIGIHDAEKAFGLRPGEALKCIHADEEPGGCGTSEYCSTCGAAVAIVAAIKDDRPAERICALTANKGGRTVELAISVRSHPMRINRKRFILLFLQDITLQQQRAALERTFFHDIKNLLGALLGASEMLAATEQRSNLVKTIHQASLRLHKEVAIQSCLMDGESSIYVPMYHEFTAAEILEELKSSFVYHEVARNKTLEFPAECPDISIRTDISSLLRVLSNMVKNALEATEEEGKVRIWLEQGNSFVSFHVWNRQAIPQEIALRIFQRNFTTKEEAGRGLGTYSMKLFGEKILGGQVSFTTSGGSGTVFKFSLPL